LGRQILLQQRGRTLSGNAIASRELLELLEISVAWANEIEGPYYGRSIVLLANGIVSVTLDVNHHCFGIGVEMVSELVAGVPLVSHETMNESTSF
jgi:hypothetical protein